MCDKDSSISDTSHIPIYYDPGHIAKIFQKSLMARPGCAVQGFGGTRRSASCDCV